MKSRLNLPQYAERDSVTLTSSQFLKICKKGIPDLIKREFRPIYKVAKTKDGICWVRVTGNTVFWVQRWYEIPKVVYTRAKAIDEFIERL